MVLNVAGSHVIGACCTNRPRWSPGFLAYCWIHYDLEGVAWPISFIGLRGLPSLPCRAKWKDSWNVQMALRRSSLVQDDPDQDFLLSSPAVRLTSILCASSASGHATWASPLKGVLTMMRLLLQKSGEPTTNWGLTLGSLDGLQDLWT